MLKSINLILAQTQDLDRKKYVILLRVNFIFICLNKPCSCVNYKHLLEYTFSQVLSWKNWDRSEPRSLLKINSYEGDLWIDLFWLPRSHLKILLKDFFLFILKIMYFSMLFVWQSSTKLLFKLLHLDIVASISNKTIRAL